MYVQFACSILLLLGYDINENTRLTISLCSLAEVLKVSKPVQSPHRWALNRIAVNDTEANNYLRKESKMMMGALRTVEDPSLPLEALSCLPDHHDHPTQLLSQIFHAPPDCVIGSGRLRASPGDTRLSFLHHLIPYDPVPPPTRLSTHCPLCLLLSLFERFAFQLLIYHTFTISQDQCRHSPLDFGTSPLCRSLQDEPSIICTSV